MWFNFMKNFPLFFLKYGSSRYFSGSLAVFEEHGEPAGGRAARLRGLFLAAFGGEKCSNYFQYSAHGRICQAFRLAASRLGGQIERDFPAERQFLVL